MPALTQVTDLQTSAAAQLNQYRSLFTGGHVYDAVAGYGADNTGATDASAAINAAITAAAGKGTAFVPAGTYLINNQLVLPSNTTLLMHPQAFLQRNFSGAGTIANHAAVTYGLGNSGAVQDTHITIIGGNLGLASGAPSGQHLILWYVTDLQVLDMTIGNTVAGAWMTWFLDCFHVLIANCVLNNPSTGATLNDGLHIESGRYYTVSNCYISTGDDAVALGNLSGTVDLQDVVLSNCSLVSGLSRALAIYAQNSHNVIGIEVSNVTCTSAGTGPAVELVDYWNTNTYQAAVTADTPYLYWRLKEASGTTAADTSGNSRPGTYSGSGVTYAQRGGLRDDISPSATGYNAAHNYDNCVVLDGVNGQVTRASVALGASYSMECLFKSTGVPGTTTRILAVGTNPMLLAAFDGTLQLNDGAGHTLTTTKSFCDGAWHHVVATYNTTGTVSTIYVDGVLQVTTTSQAFAAPSSATFSVSVTGAMTPMAVDEVALYSSVLTSTRVAAHFNNAMRARLVHHIHLNNMHVNSSSTSGVFIHRASKIWAHQVNSTAGSFVVQDAEDVTLSDCFAVRTAGASTAVVADTVQDFTLRSGTYDGQNTATIGISGNYVARGNWLGATIRNINGTGIQLTNSSGVKVVGNTVTFCNSPLTELLPSPGISHHDLVAENDFRNNLAAPGVAGVGSAYRGNMGYNPVGSVTAPTIGASPYTVTNNTGVDVIAYVTNAGTTGPTISVGGVSTGIALTTTLKYASVRIPVGQSVTLTYTGTAPTWVWVGD